MNVGWVGLGAMGAPMAGRVAAAGHTVAAFDVDPSRSAPGTTVVASLAEAAAGAEVLALTVATPAQAEAVLFGPGAAAEALAPGAVVLVMATVGPEPVAGWAARLAVRGVGLVDAPVSGGVARARSGDLLVMAGGADLDKVTPILEAVASTVRVVGPAPGDGQKVKLVNQLLAGVHIAAAAEALAFAGALGLDPRQCWETVRHGAAASFMLDDRGARMLAEDFSDVRSALDIFVKDMGLVADAARAGDIATPVAAAAGGLYERGRAAGLGRLDDAVLIEVVRRKHPAEGRTPP